MCLSLLYSSTGNSPFNVDNPTERSTGLVRRFHSTNSFDGFRDCRAIADRPKSLTGRNSISTIVLIVADGAATYKQKKWNLPHLLNYFCFTAFRLSQFAKKTPLFEAVYLPFGFDRWREGSHEPVQRQHRPQPRRLLRLAFLRTR